MSIDAGHEGAQRFTASAAIRWVGVPAFLLVAALETGVVAALSGWERLIFLLVTAPLVWSTWIGLRRGARSVTVTPAGLTVVPHFGRAVSATWDDVIVRQRWAWRGAERALEMVLGGSRYVAYNAHVRDFDTLVAAVLDAAGEDRISRRGTKLNRALWGGYVPRRDEERRVLTRQERRRIGIAAVISVTVPMGLVLLAALLLRR